MRNLIRNVSHNSRCAPRSTVNFAMNPPSPLGATISSAGIAALLTFATDLPREIFSQSRLEVALAPSGFQVFLALCCIGFIQGTFPVNKLERSRLCGVNQTLITCLQSFRQVAS